MKVAKALLLVPVFSDASPLSLRLRSLIPSINLAAKQIKRRSFSVKYVIDGNNNLVQVSVCAADTVDFPSKTALDQITRDYIVFFHSVVRTHPMV
ncbi:hypothetical protein DFH09DRAFT_1138319 [Mycena vulgaris]|nr:hypothetical protein DFH09DRAFT_1138319 [Mycena vulgaris]